MRSIQHGHKYIWQSLPRALELWFEYKNDTDNKITTFMRSGVAKIRVLQNCDCFIINFEPFWS